MFFSGFILVLIEIFFEQATDGKKLCNEFSRGFSFFSYSHTVFSFLNVVVVSREVSFFSLSHTNTKAHRDGKLYGKLIYILVDSISCAAFLLFNFSSKSISDTIMSYFPLLFMFEFLHTDALVALLETFPSCTTLLSFPHCVILFGLTTKNNLAISICGRTQTKGARRLSLLLNPIVKCFYFFLNGGDFMNMKTGAEKNLILWR